MRRLPHYDGLAPALVLPCPPPLGRLSLGIIGLYYWLLTHTLINMLKLNNLLLFNFKVREFVIPFGLLVDRV